MFNARRHFAGVCFSSALAALAGPTIAQTVQSIPSLPANIISAIKAAKVQSIFDVNGNRDYSGNVIVADQIVFQDDNSALTFTNMKVPYILIVTPDLKLVDSSRTYWIRRAANLSGSNGAQGGNGAAGAPSYIHNQGKEGRAGGSGGPGQAGQPGETPKLPPVYLVVGKIDVQKGNPLDASVRMFFPGLTGGNGGIGGNGGNGGNGEKGGDSADGLLNCKHGPGRGGAAGNGGLFGAGGAAGNGGDGATIYLAGPSSVISLLTYFPIGNRGGMPGLPGECGMSGYPGSTGDQGRLSHMCRSGPGAGAAGSRPARPLVCRGPEGHAGGFGKVYAITMDLAGLLKK